MSSKLASAMLIAAGIIHLLPLSGLLGAGRLADLYGLAPEALGPELEILLRHRAVLFGMLGLFLIGAAFAPALQLAALAAGVVSVISFIWLAWSVGDYNHAIHRVVIADYVALACLLLAAAAVAVRQSGMAAGLGGVID